MNPHLVAKDDAHCVAVWNQTIIHIWRGAATLSAVEGMADVCTQVLAQNRGRVTCLAVVKRDSPPPDEAARSALARWSREVVPRMELAVLVAEGGGFRAALVRGVGTALTALAPHKVPFKFSNSIEDALKLLGPLLPPRSGGIATLREVVADLLAEMDGKVA